MRQFWKKVKDFVWMSHKVLQLAWQTHRGYTVALILSAFISALVPTFQIYIGKLIIDELVSVVTQGGTGSMIFSLVSLEFVLALIHSAVQSFNDYIWILMRDHILREIELQVLTKALSLDFSFFDSSEFHDKLTTIERESSWRPIDILRGYNNLFSGFISLVSTLSLLLAIGGWVVALLLGVAIPSLVLGMRYARYRYSITDSRSPISKKVNYLTNLITWLAPGEIKIFQIGDYILDEYKNLYTKFVEQTREFGKKKHVFQTSTSLLSNVVYYGVYLWLLRQAIRGLFTVGDVTLYSSAFERARGAVNRITNEVTSLYAHILFMQDFFEFMSYKPKVLGPPNPEPFMGIDRQGSGIEFKNLSFRYKEDQDWILKDINLQIPPNTNLAFVGENGAGKTTLIKLLLRFYDPQKGEVLINGTDLRAFEVDSYYDKIAALHQDFSKYQLTVQENIGFGRLEEIDNLGKIKSAARKAGIAEFIETELSDGYQSQLGTRFEGGVDLSVGQWQRMALARAFMRDGEILILDEPTAALDAKAEYEVFKRFVDLVEDKISILISHRFSTVRLADEIVVLDDGQIIEQGSHQELLDHDGQYATMFNLQAKGYR